MVEDKSVDFLKERSPEDFKDSILKVHERLKNESHISPKEGKSAGRPKGLRKDPVTGNWSKPSEEASAASTQANAPLPSFGDGFSPQELKYLLTTVVFLIEQKYGKRVPEKIIDDGSILHARVLNKRCPDFLKEYADLGLLAGWWGTMFAFILTSERTHESQTENAPKDSKENGGDGKIPPWAKNGGQSGQGGQNKKGHGFF